MKHLSLVLVTLATLLLGAASVYALSSSDFNYNTGVTVTNNTGSALSNEAVRVPWNAQTYVDNGYLAAKGDDIFVEGGAGAEQKIMAHIESSDPSSWWLPISSLGNGDTAQFTFYTGGATAGVDNPQVMWLQGASESLDVTDDASLDITTDLTLEVPGVNLASIPAGETCLVCKDGAYELGIRNGNEVFGRITSNGDELVVSHSISIDTDYDFTLTFDGTTLALSVDGTQEDSQSFQANQYSGGTEDVRNGFRVHKFASSGTLTVVNDGPDDVNYLVVGGGGAGGGATTEPSAGGGGGAGGVLNGTTDITSNATITVGAGGTGGSSQGDDGGDSAIQGLVTVTGGGGGGYGEEAPTNATDGRAGGSGGGGGQFGIDDAGTGGSGTAGQGNDGGDSGAAGSSYGGGGGGASAAGQDGPAAGGDGGDGTTIDVAGVNVTVGGGGGGGDGEDEADAGTGGTGGGGDGGITGSGPTAGQDETGGGGGGASDGSGGAGADGGDGVVYVWYPTASPTVDLTTNANPVTVGPGLTGDIGRTRILDSGTAVLDLPFYPGQCSQSQEGDAGNSWTWLGTCQDQSASDNDADYTFVRDTSNIDVVVGSLDVTSAAAAAGDETFADVVEGDHASPVADPYSEAGDFKFPLTLITDHAGSDVPSMFLAFVFVLFGGLIAGGAVLLSPLRSLGMVSIAASVGFGLLVYMTPMENIFMVLAALPAAATPALTRDPWERI